VADPVSTTVPIANPIPVSVVIPSKPIKKEEPVVVESPKMEAVQNPTSGEDTEDENMTEISTGRKILVGFIAVVLGLFAIFYGVFLWGLLGGNLSNPLFESLGLEASQLKALLLSVTLWVFGTLSFIFFLAFLIKFFQWAMTKSGDIRKKHYIKRSGVNLFLFLLLAGIGVGLYVLIDGAVVKPPLVDQKLESMISTVPDNTIGLTSPITVTFDIGKKLYEKVKPELIRQIQWDFDGDGAVDASGPKVTYRFLDKGVNEGRFNVRATVTYFSPATNEEKTFVDTRDVIISNEAIQAALSATPEVGQGPMLVKFSATKSIDPDGQIVLYEWDMNEDGEFELSGGMMSTQEKIYSEIGDYKVRMRVTGGNNDFAIAEKTITVHPPDEKMRASISSIDSAFEGVVPMTITLSGETSFAKESSIVEYEWEITGEKKSTLGRTIQRTFHEPGTYEVKLTVTDRKGAKDQTTQVINVYEEKNISIFTSPTPDKETGILQGELPFELTFDASKSEIPRAVEWRWDFENDGIVDAFERTVQHVFRKAGIFTTKLVIVDDKGNEYDMTQNVIVTQPNLTARISTNPVSGVVPLQVTFDGAGSTTSEGDIIDFIWSFPGEDPGHYGSKVTYEFKKVGVFTVGLTVLNTKGEKASTETLVSVRSKDLQARFETKPSETKKKTFIFDPLKSTGDIQSYFWEFGDGKSSREVMPAHTYEQAGVYNAKLKVTGFSGVVTESTNEIRVIPE
jgi:PKD repeat protein